MTSITVSAEVLDTTLAEKTAGDVTAVVEYENFDTVKYAEYFDKIQKTYIIEKTVIEVAPESAVFSGTSSNLTEIAGKNTVLQDNTAGDVSFTFSVEKSGLYSLGLDYYIDCETSATVKRNLYVDGKILFEEASGILFLQKFCENTLDKKNNYGDELRGDNLPIKEWYHSGISDSIGFCEGDFAFYFSEGIHTVKLVYAENDMYLGTLYVSSVEQLPNYEDVKKVYKNNGYKAVESDVCVTLEAESNIAYIDDVTIRRENSSDITVTPSDTGKKLLNVYGGSRWDEGNRTVAWNISVKKDGLYKIALSSCQNFADGIPVFRQIKIDGEIPFAEMSAYAFPYTRNYRFSEIADAEGTPYLFYLTKGKHTFSMTVKLGKMAQAIENIENHMAAFSDIQLRISKITGNEIDPNYDYEFFSKIDGLEDEMRQLSKDLEKTYEYIVEVSGRTPSAASSIKSIKSGVDAMLKNPFSIAKNFSDLENAQTTLGTWYLSLKSSAMAVDKIYIASPDAKIKYLKHNFFKVIIANIKSLASSFARSYTEVSGYIEAGVKVTDSISVWIARGSEWAETIKQLTDSQFTPKTGIEIKLNTVPASQLNSGSANVLMLSLVSGKQPDVALAIANNSPVEFAIRDAVADLSKFPDYNDIIKRFYKEALTTYKYNGGVYALPETMNFKVLFYRKDIVSQYGIHIPNTREELYSKTLPALYREGFSFAYPRDDSEFILQYGGSYYTKDGKKSALDSPEVFSALKEETELYTQYSIPVTANFYNRFRTGEMPMGIADYTTYLQLLSAAPEISGKWAIAPIPGKLKNDGSIDRSVAAFQCLSDVILAASHKKEQAWEFLKWWTSAEVQINFANEVETVLGEEARWNTSNIEAFVTLPWKSEDLAVITQMLESDVEVPVVLGGYYTTRYLTNAWNKVVNNGAVLRDELENAVVNINKELRSKQREYGVAE